MILRKDYNGGVALIKEYREDSDAIVVFDFELDDEVVATDRYVWANVFDLTDEEIASLGEEPEIEES